MMKKPQDCKNLEDIRAEIDTIDRQIISLLAQRFGFVRAVTKYKKNDKDSIIAIERYNAVLQNRRKLAEEYQLDPDVIEKMYKLLLDYFISEEMKVLNLK
mgnify:CR=1 FL=1